MRLLHTSDDLDRFHRDHRDIVLVPTMGALHEGHLELVRQGARAGPTIVSVFVNPTQFNEAVDFERYPRTLVTDCEAAASAGAVAVFSPEVDTVYGEGPREDVPLPWFATDAGLEDAHRPGHFKGVYQVCERLFRLVRPVVAIFGEKDWQQYQLMRVLVRQESLPIHIAPGPTVRSDEGLALSSRNRFIPDDRHEAALALSRGLVACQLAPTVGDAEATLHRVLRDAGVEWDYAAVRDPESLRPLDPASDTSIRARALVAARIGDVRLLDNMPWGAWS